MENGFSQIQLHIGIGLESAVNQQVLNLWIVQQYSGSHLHVLVSICVNLTSRDDESLNLQFLNISTFCHLTVMVQISAVLIKEKPIIIAYWIGCILSVLKYQQNSILVSYSQWLLWTLIWLMFVCKIFSTGNSAGNNLYENQCLAVKPVFKVNMSCCQCFELF